MTSMQAIRLSRRSDTQGSRSGIATVEFAVLVPLFLILVLGMTEMSRACQVTADLTSAVREGGRMASMDLTSRSPSNQPINQKITQDMRNFLSACGIPGNEVTITITRPGTDTSFDLSDQNNYLQSFQITASIPYSLVSRLPADYMNGRVITCSAVYRLGRSMVTD